MKLADIWTRTAEYSDDVTKNSRQLSLGGIAVCWVLKGSDPIGHKLLWSLAFFVLFFLLDLLQAFVSFIVRRIWLYRTEHRLHREGSSVEDADVSQPRHIDTPGFVLFITKAVALLFAYLFLIAHVVATAVR